MIKRPKDRRKEKRVSRKLDKQIEKLETRCPLRENEALWFGDQIVKGFSSGGFLEYDPPILGSPKEKNWQSKTSDQILTDLKVRVDKLRNDMSEKDSKGPSNFSVQMLTWGDPRQRPNYVPGPQASGGDPLEVALSVAKAKIARQDAYLKKISAASHLIGTVTDIRGDRMTITTSGMQYDVCLLENAQLGDVVSVSPESMQAIALLPTVSPSGVIATVQNLLPGGKAEIEYGGLRVVRLPPSVAADVGDRVMVDASLSVALQNLGKPKSILSFEKATGTTWDDVGGHEEAKKALRDAIETPKNHPELFAKYGRRPTKGVLLYGPPGTGKTLLARAAATSLAKTHGHEVSPGFIYVKGPALLSKWVGESESSVRAIFSAAREHKRLHGYPALVFIDEAEAVLGRRGEGHSTVITQTLVPQFLAEMDGLEDSGALVLLATNRPGDLDPAVTREGRIDRKVLVGRPKREDTERIALIHLRGKPLSPGLSHQDLASQIADQIHGEEIGAFILGDFRAPVFMSSFSSGAMIAGIVESAAESALNRDVASGSFSGISLEDAKVGVHMALHGLAGGSIDVRGIAEEFLSTNPGILNHLGDDAKNHSPSLALHDKAKAPLSN